MMDKLRNLVAANLIVSALVVFVWIGYAALNGIPIDETCMGFRRSWRLDNTPAWVVPLVIEGVVLILFSLRSRVSERKVRFLIGGFSALFLLCSFVLPRLIEDIYGTKFFTTDVGLWWYACFANVAYGLAGSSTPAA